MKTIWLYMVMIKLAFLFSTLQVFAGEGEKSFFISGNFKKVKQGKIFLLQQVSLVERSRNPGAYLRDSAVIVNGKFSFKGTIKSDIVPVYFTMQTAVSEAERAADPLAGNQTRYFYLMEGKLHVSGNDLEDMVISGNVEMAAFMKLDNSLRQQRTAFGNAFRKQLKVSLASEFPGKADSIAFYAAQMDSLKKLQISIESDFIVQHPSALINVAILKGRAALAETSGAREIGNLVAALAPELRNRADMVAVSNRMKGLASLVAGNPALAFSLPDTAGNAVALSSFRGKYVLIEFWASWCGPCRMQIPYLKKSYAAFQNKGFEILGVSLDENREKWMKAIHDEQLPWTQVSDVKGLESPVVAMYGITGIPLNFLLDTNGVIIARDLRDNELSVRLSELLSSKTATEGPGVHFDHALSWEQVKAKAKAENKYIFMDCYATWCAPCVKMIKELFPRKEMGDFFNDKFICVKLQLDKTDKDDDYVKMWYKDAQMIHNTYKLPSMPTFLYFSPDGELVHRVPGSEDADRLITKSTDALDPEKQYYTLVKKFGQSDKKNTDMMKKLAIMSQQVMEKDNALRYADMYVNSQDDLLTKENILFLNRFSSSGKLKGFEIFMNYGNRVDEVLGAGVANNRVQEVIFNEEVMPLLTNSAGSVPDWKAIQTSVAAKYPAHAEPVVGKFKAQYYMSRNDWPNFQKSVMAYMKKYGPAFTDKETFNVFARAIFENSPDRDCITAALGWSKRALAEDGANREFMNVYAGLLHKSGKTKEAVAVMEKAVELASGSEKENYMVTLGKMKKGEKTWKN
ncbi:Peroxiredoxin [Chitinophaga ginsengisegetis]|uniref:Peroxiredoxin n=2 Tax=Chitinophaga ginsengisegetis TaxID=393003 RepID=A0A1T5N5L7_9BACT|nr:Peroxiredoxin [Chitinophaga ginsengisegetis]